MVLLFFFIALTGCAVAEVKQPAKNVEVTIQKFKFIPEVVEISKGQTIRWVNKERRQYHTVWFDKYGEEESEYLFPDDTFVKTFNKTGEFDYRCGPHPEMLGKVIVK